MESLMMNLSTLLFKIFYDNSQQRRLLFFDLMLVILAIAFLVALQLGHTLYPKIKVT